MALLWELALTWKEVMSSPGGMLTAINLVRCGAGDGVARARVRYKPGFLLCSVAFNWEQGWVPSYRRSTLRVGSKLVCYLQVCTLHSSSTDTFILEGNSAGAHGVGQDTLQDSTGTPVPNCSRSAASTSTCNGSSCPIWITFQVQAGLCSPHNCALSSALAAFVVMWSFAME